MPTDQAVLEFFPDADTAGFRLHELGVLNWGTFHGKPFVVRPEGRTAILTGGNGTGKSTLADALLTLLVPNTRRNYNQAGQTQKKSERNERDYVLGAYSEKHDESIGEGRKQYLRKDAGSYSVLLATFNNEGMNSWVTLAQVLWINTANKVDKLFIAEPRRLSIEGDFNYLEAPSTIRRILKDRGFSCLDSFTAYSEKFHDMLCMPKDKTPMAIFNQAICIKDIGDLTSFIREHMLDDGGALEKLQGLRKNFTELRETNRRIELATKQLDALNLINNDHEVLVVLQRDLDDLHFREQVLVPYFAERELELRKELAEQQAIQRSTLDTRRMAVTTSIGLLHGKVKSIEESLERSDEGRRLKEIERAVALNSTLREERKKKRAAFDVQRECWSPGQQVFDATTHGQLLYQCGQEAPVLKGRVERIDKVDVRNRVVEEDHVSTKRNELEKEQKSLLERTSNIPEHCLRARAYLLDELRLKPEDLPFVGELVQVKSTDNQWTGAIERLMHSFALCMVVRRDLRERVDGFVHSHRQKGLVVYHAVPEQIGAVNPHLDESAVARKVELKAGLGELGHWLEVEISHRFDHLCCPDTGPGFREASNALTLMGLIKHKGTERRKDDRSALGDASNFVLGWNNREKLVAIGAELKGLESRLLTIRKEIGELEEEQALLTRRINAGDKLAMFYASYTDIDWQIIAKEIADLEVEQTKLKTGSDTLKQLAKEKTATELALKEAQAEEKRLIGEAAVLEDKTKGNVAAKMKMEEVIKSVDQVAAQDSKFADFRAQYPAITASLAFPLTDLAKLSDARTDAGEAIKRKRAVTNESFGERTQRIKRRMEQFVAFAENIEFRDRLAGDYAVPGYNASIHAPFEGVRNQLIKEDLPKNQHRFETLLHSTVTDDVSVFDELLVRHAKRIEVKIQELNQQLRKIEFDRRDKTYIQLVPNRTDEAAVKEFRNYMRNALQDSLNAGTEREALKERYHRIEHLLNKLDENPEWTGRVVDVRNWFNFRAEESFRADDTHKQSYSGASGKSGGEKNRLASTILATSIAYQYGISVDNKHTETFRLVAVDEMFSKTDDEFSEYLLELFKEFHLQLLVIQPLDAKIHLVQKYVERYHIVTKRGANSSVRTLTVKEYKELRNEP
jgi:uncharacterized protein YPO0396